MASLTVATRAWPGMCKRNMGVGEGRVSAVAPVRLAVAEVGAGVAVVAQLTDRAVRMSSSTDRRLRFTAWRQLVERLLLWRGASTFACTRVGTTASASLTVLAACAPTVETVARV